MNSYTYLHNANINHIFEIYNLVHFPPWENKVDNITDTKRLRSCPSLYW